MVHSFPCLSDCVCVFSGEEEDDEDDLEVDDEDL